MSGFASAPFDLDDEVKTICYTQLYGFDCDINDYPDFPNSPFQRLNGEGDAEHLYRCIVEQIHSRCRVQIDVCLREFLTMTPASLSQRVRDLVNERL